MAKYSRGLDPQNESLRLADKEMARSRSLKKGGTVRTIRNWNGKNPTFLELKIISPVVFACNAGWSRRRHALSWTVRTLFSFLGKAGICSMGMGKKRLKWEPENDARALKLPQ